MIACFPSRIPQHRSRKALCTDCRSFRYILLSMCIMHSHPVHAFQHFRGEKTCNNTVLKQGLLSQHSFNRITGSSLWSASFIYPLCLSEFYLIETWGRGELNLGTWAGWERKGSWDLALRLGSTWVFLWMNFCQWRTFLTVLQPQNTTPVDPWEAGVHWSISVDGFLPTGVWLSWLGYSASAAPMDPFPSTKMFQWIQVLACPILSLLIQAGLAGTEWDIVIKIFGLTTRPLVRKEGDIQLWISGPSPHCSLAVNSFDPAWRSFQHMMSNYSLR